MPVYYAALAAVVAAALIWLVVSAVHTLRQAEKTAAEAETLLKKLNVEMDNVRRVSESVAGLAGAASGFLTGATAKTLASLAGGLFQFWRGRRTAERGPEKPPSEKKY